MYDMSIYLLDYKVYPCFALDQVGLAGFQGRMGVLEIIEMTLPEPNAEYAGIMVHTPEGEVLVYGGLIIENQDDNDDIVRLDPDHRVETWLLNQVEMPSRLRADIDTLRFSANVSQ